MSNRVRADIELGGVGEIAKEFGVGTNNVAMWSVRRSSNGFPSPVVVLDMGSIYDMDAVRRWYRDKPPPRNRPKERSQHHDHPHLEDDSR